MHRFIFNLQLFAEPTDGGEPAEPQSIDDVLDSISLEEIEAAEKGEPTPPDTGSPENAPAGEQASGEPEKEPPSTAPETKTYTQQELDSIMQKAIDRNNASKARQYDTKLKQELSSRGVDDQTYGELQKIAQANKWTMPELMRQIVSTINQKPYQGPNYDPRVDAMMQEREFEGIRTRFVEDFGEKMGQDDQDILVNFASENQCSHKLAYDFLKLDAKSKDLEKKLADADKRAEQRVFSMLKEKAKGRVNPGTNNVNVIPRIETKGKSLDDVLGEIAKGIPDI